MEMKKKKDSSLKDFIEEKPLKGFPFPQEDYSSSMTTTKKTFKILFRPNNYRRQVQIKHLNSSTSIGKLSTILNVPMENISRNNHTKIITIKKYKGITIQIFKKNIIGIYSQNKIGGHKETFLIETNKSKDLDTRITQIKTNIQKKIDEGILHLAKKLKVYKSLKQPIWIRHENWIKGEDYIDKIPRETIIHDTIFKKVYNEGIEFIGGKNSEPDVKIKTYLKNRALEDIAPEIAESLREFTNTLTPTLKEFAENMKTHVKVMKEIDKSFRKFNKLLSQRKLNEWRR